ncbi:MAG: substrate-binding domain-containing protein [Firmicutes bacterium]|nr:substrate-binding domain-containing protein [Bacillota bacterium]
MQRFSRAVVAILVAVILASMLAGCGGSSAPAPQSPPPKAPEAPQKKEVVLGVSLPSSDNPFFVRMRNGIEDAAKKAGVTAKVLLAQENQSKQLSDIEDLIQSKVDAIIFVPVDVAAAVPAVEAAVKAKIPVIDLNRRVNSDKYITRIGSDDVQVGAKIAEYICRKLNGKGQIVLLRGQAGASVAEQRREGFMNTLKKYPDIKILADMTCKHQRAEGLRIMEDLLQAHKTIDAVYCINDEVALGAMGAITAAKRQGIIVTGIDANPDALQAIKDGKITLTVAQKPVLMGRLGVESALNVIKGEKIDKEIVTDIVMIDKENVSTVDLTGN